MKSKLNWSVYYTVTERMEKRGCHSTSQEVKNQIKDIRHKDEWVPTNQHVRSSQKALRGQGSVSKQLSLNCPRTHYWQWPRETLSSVVHAWEWCVCVCVCVSQTNRCGHTLLPSYKHSGRLINWHRHCVHVSPSDNSVNARVHITSTYASLPLLMHLPLHS